MSTPTTSTAERGAAREQERRRGVFLRVVTNPFFPFILQAGAFAVLISLIAAGWGRHGIAGMKIEGPLIYTNFATLGFWVVWLMGLLLLLPLVGRLWCTLCPVGGCSDLASRIGAKLPYPRRLQNFLPMAVLLFLFLAGTEIFRLNRYPDATAWLLTGVTAAAVATGLLFRGRVFCRWWCPVGGTVGLFTRMAPVEVGAKDQEVCRGCESKACWFGGSRWYKLSWSGWHSLFRFRRPGCPAAIFPPEAAANAACLMCAGCLKNCPWDNLRWGTRPWGSGLWRESARDRSEALLLVLLFGAVFYRLGRFWPPLRGILEWPAAGLAGLAPSLSPTAVQTINLTFTLLLWPLFFFALLALAAKLLSEVSITSWPADGDRTAGLLYDLAEIDEERRSEEQGWSARRLTPAGYLASFGHAFIPLVAGGYGAFALVKLNEKLGYLPTALADPAGVRTFLAMNDLQLIAPPESLVALTAIRWGAIVLAAGGILISLWSAGKLGASVYGDGSPPARRGALVFRAGILFAGTLMLLSLKAWLFRGGI